MKTQGRSARPSSSLRLFVVLSAAILALSALLPIEAAKAQQRPRTIVEMLFGGGNRMNEAPSQQRVKKRVIRRQGASSRAKPARTRSTSRATPQRSRAPAAAVAASAPTVDKDENAKTVLVVGDFLADGLADGSLTSPNPPDVASAVLWTALHGLVSLHLASRVDVRLAGDEFVDAAVRQSLAPFVATP